MNVRDDNKNSAALGPVPILTKGTTSPQWLSSPPHPQGVVMTGKVPNVPARKISSVACFFSHQFTQLPGHFL
jgi:hypothetical protein